MPDGALKLGIRPEYLALASPGAPGAVPARVRQVQDVGTHLMLSAEVQGTVLKARLGVEWLKLAPGDEVWLQLLGQHTCFYVNEELVS